MNRMTDFLQKSQLTSLLLVFVLVAAGLFIMVPLTAPRVRGQITHLASAWDEDNVPPYDIDGALNGVVVWNPAEDHILTADYMVDAGFTLNIPALDFMGNQMTASDILFQADGIQIEVFGTLVTNSDNNELTKTLFWGGDTWDWKGIVFRPGSSGNITDSIMDGATDGLHLITDPMGSPMTLLAPGITDTTVRDIGNYGVRFSSVEGYLNMDGCNIEDNFNSGLGMRVFGTDLDLKNTAIFGHGDGKSSLEIMNSDVTAENLYINGKNQLGNLVFIQDSPWYDDSNGTVFRDSSFTRGEAGVPLVRVDGVTPFFDNCSFDTNDGEDSVLAYDVNDALPAHITLRNPTADGTPGFWDGSFDNSTLNATGNSTITLQWYMNVNVIDPDGNPIANAPATVSAPASPSSKSTDASGWAEWFTVTELIQYNDSVSYIGSYNISATNNSMVGYADPEPTFDLSKEIFVVVPFNPIPNNLPEVTFISTPVGIRSGPVTIDFTLTDLDPGDDGNMSVQVYFWDDSIGDWKPATAHPSSDPTTSLSNGVTYQFVWDSKDKDFNNRYSTEVYIQIVPYDKSGSNGTPVQTGNFTVDNLAPGMVSGPVATPYNTTALIEWTVDEPATATVWYGLYGDGTVSDLTSETTGSSGSASQSVTLTGLLPGRRYTYVFNSTDPLGNKFSSDPGTATFTTYIYIQLYTGWNMISIPHWLLDIQLGDVLSTVSGDWDIAMWYDAQDPDDKWKTNYTGKPGYMTDLTEYFPYMALWLHVTTDTLLIPNYMFDNGYPGEDIQLVEGWNFVGYNSVEPRDIDVALTSIAGSYDAVQHYDAASGEWLTYDGPAGQTDTLTNMELGRGYWIHATEDVVWTNPYL